MSQSENAFLSCLIFVNVICQFCLSQFIESDNDKSHEDVDEEEWKDHEIHDVEDGHFGAEAWNRTFVFVRRRHGVFQNAEKK